MTNNEQGFTLIEAVIGLSALLLLASLFPFVIRTVSPPQEEGIHPQEASLFFHQIGSEVKSAYGAKIVFNRLYLSDSTGSQISYERYGNRMIRRVDGDGHELTLQNIVEFNPEIRGNRISLSVRDKNGREYERSYIMVVPHYEELSK
jgi:competence protein ComGF